MAWSERGNLYTRLNGINIHEIDPFFVMQLAFMVSLFKLYLVNKKIISW